MFLSLRGGAPPPAELTRAQVCERMGWTFAYYDSVEWTEIVGLLQVWDGIRKAQTPR